MGVRTANGSDQWLAGNMTELIVPLITAPLTMTDATQAAQFAGGTWLYSKADLKGYTQVRLTGRVAIASASANTPKVVLKYHTAFSTTVGDFSDIGVSEVGFSIFTGATLGDSGWVSLATAAKIKDAFLTLVASGGDGAADPAIAQVMAHFR